MPLSELPTDILRALAAQRRPDSYVARSTPLNREGPRYSGDIDIFQDSEERVAPAATADESILIADGFSVEWVRQEAGIYTAFVRRAGDETRLEWVRDSDFRFFPAIPDELFGYTLHPADIATNKALAAAGRRAPRDVLDLLHIHEHHLRLGAVIWAAVGKDPGWSPESLIAEIRRNARYQPDEYAALPMAGPIDAGAVAQRLRAALEEAEAFVRAMPAGKEGLLFLKDGQPVEPDPQHLELCIALAGRRQTIWPGSSEISHAMLERYGAADPPPSP